MNKIFIAIAAAMIVSAPAVIDTFSIEAKAGVTPAPVESSRAGQQVRFGDADSLENGCKVIIQRERAMDGSTFLRKITRCA